jgi:hypothetical protein
MIPDYDLVVVTTGGNYSVTLAEQPFEILQKHILPYLV